MGIMSNKVTRRVAIGSVVGLAAAPLVFRALRAKYYVNGASARTVGGRKIVRKFRGQEITLDIPRMELRTPEDEEKLRAILIEQVKKNPKFVEMNKSILDEWKAETKAEGVAQIDESEKRELEELAKTPVREQEKRALAKQIRETAQACRKKVSEAIANSEVKPPSL